MGISVSGKNIVGKREINTEIGNGNRKKHCQKKAIAKNVICKTEINTSI